MTSSRLILLFLGFIFLVIVILSSNRIAAGVRDRFGKFLPFIKSESATQAIPPTPTPTIKKTAFISIPTPTLIIYGEKSTNSSEIPATGLNNVVWLILGGSLTLGGIFKKITCR